MKKKLSLPAVFLILLVVLFLLNASIVVTYPNEYTIIKQFGRIESIRQTPGLSFKIPFLQTAEKYRMKCFYMTLQSAT